MSQSILNLMLSNLDDSSEKSEHSETKSIFDGFELVNNQCDGNCNKKMKSILQHAANLIQLKDRQIDNLIMALNRSPEIKNSHETKNDDMEDGEKPKADEDVNIADVVLKYEDKLKEANTLLEESFSLVKSLEIQKEQLETQLAEKITENDIFIKNYEAKQAKETGHQEGQDQGNNKIANQVEIIFSNRSAEIVQVSNDIAGTGWMIISRHEMVNEQLTPTLEVNIDIVSDIVNGQQHELYIHRLHKDGSSSFAHYDNFILYKEDFSKLKFSDLSRPVQIYKIAGMDSLRSSIPIRGDFTVLSYSRFIEKFTPNCIFVQFMVREKQS
ncbi:uncharacterized protein LOC111519603 [Drosophila willistoni]|uniref:uncharacterized protein LOC111519603 n=1 Tax=Drosophila willistoni TaxID=7260 RepID=UPI000C26C829|nr:uncharacterized protein LOC111519603 [Drosophila willistoni]XP_046865569.1 uncharacterized protein LOC111519603 [Drosophila willistoni]